MVSTSRAHASKHCNHSRQNANTYDYYGVWRHRKEMAKPLLLLFLWNHIVNCCEKGIHHADEAAHKEVRPSLWGQICDSSCRLKTFAWHLVPVHQCHVGSFQTTTENDNRGNISPVHTAVKEIPNHWGFKQMPHSLQLLMSDEYFTRKSWEEWWHMSDNQGFWWYYSNKVWKVGWKKTQTHVTNSWSMKVWHLSSVLFPTMLVEQSNL